MILKVISAEKVMYEGETSSVTLPGEMGQFTVLPRHASLVSTLTAGVVKYGDVHERQQLEIQGGIVDVHNDIVSVCIY